MFEKDLGNLHPPDLCNKELFSLSGDTTPAVSSSLNNVQHVGAIRHVPIVRNGIEQSGGVMHDFREGLISEGALSSCCDSFGGRRRGG
jgi:hypothetical protein